MSRTVGGSFAAKGNYKLLTFSVRLVGTLMLVSAVLANGSAAEERLSAQLLEAMTRLEEEFRVTSGRAKYQVSVYLPKGSTGKSARPEEKVSEIIEISILGDEFIKVCKVVGDMETVKVSNPDYAFVLSRKIGSEYSMLAIQKAGRSQPDDITLAIERQDALYSILGAYNFYGLQIWDLIRDPGFKVNEISVSNDHSGVDMFRVDFDYSPPSEKTGLGIVDFTIKDGHLVFTPQNGWKLVKTCRGLGHGVPHTYPRTIRTIDEQQPEGQLAFTDRATAGILIVGEESLGSENRVVVLDHSYELIPSEEFYLSHYGLPEPSFGSNKYWLWILCISVFGVACLVVSRRMTHR